MTATSFAAMPSPTALSTGYKYTFTNAKKGDIMVLALWQVYNNSRTYTNADKLGTVYFSEGAGSTWTLVEIIQVTDDSPTVTTGQSNSYFQSFSRYSIISQS